MRLRVLSVAFPLALVGPATAGGAEQVLAALDRELHAAGHRSVVLAAAGSQSAGELHALPPVPELVDAGAARRAAEACRAEIARALAAERFDLVHLHGLDAAEYVDACGATPALWTLHLPPAFYAGAALARPPAGVTLCCVSDSQRAALPTTAARVEVVPNGVDLARWRPGGARRGFALWMGRVCAEKAPHLAIDAARAAGVPLVLAGTVHPYAAHRDYFAREVAPRLGPGARWAGTRDERRLRRLVAAARCVLVPARAAETSSLVAIEALACDTPVIAFRAGALPEIVDDGVTGFLVDDATEMAAAIRRVGTLPRGAGRATARVRHDARAMAAAYLGLYARLARPLLA